MRPLPVLAASLLALSTMVGGCAHQVSGPISANTPIWGESTQPPIIFVKSQSDGFGLPQQIIGDEHSEIVLDGLS